MQELWLPVVGFENTYSVSNLGNVMRTGKAKAAQPGRILKPSTRNGYLYVCLWAHNKQHSNAIHRLVASAFICAPQDGYVVNHKNGIKSDNKLENLEWISQRDNVLHGLFTLGNVVSLPRGVNRPSAKLDEEKVREILRLREEGYGSRRLSAMFGVCRQSIVQIFTGRTWSHVSLREQTSNN